MRLATYLFWFTFFIPLSAASINQVRYEQIDTLIQRAHIGSDSSITKDLFEAFVPTVYLDKAARSYDTDEVLKSASDQLKLNAVLLHSKHPNLLGPELRSYLWNEDIYLSYILEWQPHSSSNRNNFLFDYSLAAIESMLKSNLLYYANKLESHRLQFYESGDFDILAARTTGTLQDIITALHTTLIISSAIRSGKLHDFTSNLMFSMSNLPQFVHLFLNRVSEQVKGSFVDEYSNHIVRKIKKQDNDSTLMLIDKFFGYMIIMTFTVTSILIYLACSVYQISNCTFVTNAMRGVRITWFLLFIFIRWQYTAINY